MVCWLVEIGSVHVEVAGDRNRLLIQEMLDTHRGLLGLSPPSCKVTSRDGLSGLGVRSGQITSKDGLLV